MIGKCLYAQKSNIKLKNINFWKLYALKTQQKILVVDSSVSIEYLFFVSFRNLRASLLK